MFLMSQYHKYPRLFAPINSAVFKTGEKVFLPEAQAHYLFRVLRKSSGDVLCLFNGQNGEYLAEIIQIDKKRVRLILGEQIKAQPQELLSVHLLFAPIKKNRMDFLIEKAIELGVTDLHPVITQRTENRKLNKERLNAQIIEAAEQCERMNIPTLHNIEKLPGKLQNWRQKEEPLFVALERSDAPSLFTLKPQSSWAFLIGPEGGFTLEEIEKLARCDFIQPISLGASILRAETAALLCVGFSNLSKD